jgi:DNA-directed RNA polymerase specialized sigma24 family protein
MSDSTNPLHPTDDARAEALAWLAGQFRWESLLSDLHELAARETAPVVGLAERAVATRAEDAA